MIGEFKLKKMQRYTTENVVIGQAYNKGNLVVLSSKEQSDADQKRGDDMTF